MGEVRVNPCREAADHKPCVVKRGNNATISFDYTPGKTFYFKKKISVFMLNLKLSYFFHVIFGM